MVDIVGYCQLLSIIVKYCSFHVFICILLIGEHNVVSCLVCSQDIRTGLLMSEHLESQQACKTFYTKQFNTFVIIAICLHTHPCLFCSLRPGTRLKPHLNKTESCKLRYFVKFQVDNLPELLKKLKNLKRFSYRSRRASVRRGEDVLSGVNTFRENVSTGPHTFPCAYCLTAGTKKSMIPIEDTEAHLDPTLYRAGIAYECKQCNLEPEHFPPSQPFISCIGKFTVCDLGLVAPITNEAEDDLPATTVLLPTSVSAPSQFVFLRPPLNQSKICQELYHRNFNFSANHYCAMFEGEMKKIVDADNFNYILPGYISNQNNKEIILTKPSSNIWKIPGTDDYFNRGQDNFLFACSQAGAVFLSTELTIPHYTLQSFATQVVLDGQFRLDISNDNGSTSYMIHEHLPGEECDAECEPYPLIDLFQRASVEDHVGLGTVANYTHHFFTNYMRSVILNKNSTLQPDYYDGNLEFPTWTSSTRAKIATWPKLLKDVNTKIAQRSNFSREDLSTFTALIDSILTTKTSPASLSLEFNLDSTECEEVAELALRHQVSGSVDSCQQLPSHFTLVKKAPKETSCRIREVENKYEVMRSKFKCKLLCMSEFERDIDVLTWLYDLEEEQFFLVEKSGDEIVIQFSDGILIRIDFEEEISLMMEEFSFSLLEAVYHRMLNFATVSSFAIILKSDSLHAAFVNSYNPHYLLASKLPTVTTVIGGKYREAAQLFKRGQDDPKFTIGSPLEIFSESHKQLSILEGIWRSDKNKGFTFSNTAPKFLNVSTNKKLKFIRARTTDPNKHFIETISNKIFELFQDSYEDFLELPVRFQRVLTCFQLVSYFDKCGHVDGEGDANDDLHLDQHQHEEELEGQRQVVVCNDDVDLILNLPDKINLKNKACYRKRKVPKIISYPYYEKNSEEFILCELVLFRPHSRDSYSGLTPDQLLNLYNEKDEQPEVSNQGKFFTKVQTIKRRLIPTMCEFDFGSDNVEVFFE